MVARMWPPDSHHQIALPHLEMFAIPVRWLAPAAYSSK